MKVLKGTLLVTLFSISIFGTAQAVEVKEKSNVNVERNVEHQAVDYKAIFHEAVGSVERWHKIRQYHLVSAMASLNKHGANIAPCLISLSKSERYRQRGWPFWALLCGSLAKTGGEDGKLAMQDLVQDEKAYILAKEYAAKVLAGQWPPPQMETNTKPSMPLEGKKTNDGLHCELRVEKKVWRADEIPKLYANVENQSNKNFSFVFGDLKIDINGVLYDARWSGPPPSPFPPEKRYDDIDIRLDGPFYKKGSDEHLKLTKGDYTVKVIFPAEPVGISSNKPVRIVSNPVEIKILPPRSSSAENLDTEKLRWADEETGQKLFSINDIVRFDWDKQIFELKRSAAMDLLANLKGLGQKFTVTDNTTIIYQGTFVSPLASMTFHGPIIVMPLRSEKSIQPPLFEIQDGYHSPIKKSESDLRFSKRLRKALQKADVLGKIDLSNPPPPIERMAHGWFGDKKGLRAWIEVFPETFRLHRSARVHIHLMGCKDRDENHVFDVNATLISKDGKGKFSAKKVFSTRGTVWKNIYILEMNPWDAKVSKASRVKPGDAKLSIEVFVRTVLDERAKTYSEPIDCVKTGTINVRIKPDCPVTAPDKDAASHLKNVKFKIIDETTGEPLRNRELNICQFVYFKLKLGAPSPYLDNPKFLLSTKSIVRSHS